MTETTAKTRRGAKSMAKGQSGGPRAVLGVRPVSFQDKAFRRRGDAVLLLKLEEQA
jgi:hypothetical protein